MDDADIVSERSEQEVSAALRSVRNAEAARRRAAAMDAGEMCMGCGGEIPAARRAALPGCCTCITCQEKLERGMGR